MENDNKILVTHGIEDDVLSPLKGLAKVKKWNNVPYNVMPREEVLNEIEDVIAGHEGVLEVAGRGRHPHQRPHGSPGGARLVERRAGLLPLGGAAPAHRGGVGVRGARRAGAEQVRLG